MNRIFHARIAAIHYLALLLFASLAVYGFLERSVVFAFPAMLLLVLMVERLIHTTYTVTQQGTLLVDRGRFSRTRTIPIADITRVERRTTCFSLMHYVVVEWGAGRYETLLPVKEEEFVKLLGKLRIKK